MYHCKTNRKNFKCPFMKSSGCVFPGGSCKPITSQCIGCTNTVIYEDVVYCKSYMNTESKWLSGRCPLCTVKIEVKVVEQKINPLKASKKAARSKKK